MTWAVAAGVAAAGFAAYSGYSGKQAEKDAAKYQEAEAFNNYQIQKAQQADAMARGREAAQDHMRQVSGMKASQSAVMAANGLDISQGTPASLLEDTQMMGDIDLQRIKQNAKREAWGFGVQANNFRNSANMYGATADNINPVASGLIAGAGSVASNWSAFSQG